MQALAIVIVGGLAAVGLWTMLARRSGRGRVGGVDPLGLRSPREIVEEHAALEAEDLAQLLEASNARRRRRGEPERSALDVEMLVASDRAQLRRGRDAAPDEQELDQLLEATNARRRARGLPERTRDDVRREHGVAERGRGRGPAGA